MQEMENLNTDNLMELHVRQLEKEKKDLNERLRIVAKRVDHTERAYRKAERPLLSKDYEQQQANDRRTFEAIQRTRIDASRVAHQQDLETKRRLTRMMGDYLSRNDAIIAKRAEEFDKKKEAAQKKIDEEKAKRRRTVLSQREAEAMRIEEEKRIKREQEEEAARLEAGKFIPCLFRIGLNGLCSRRTYRRGGTCSCGRSCRHRGRSGQETRGGRKGGCPTQTA
jgi:translation initiation factor 3 subunit A